MQKNRIIAGLPSIIMGCLGLGLIEILSWHDYFIAEVISGLLFGLASGLLGVRFPDGLARFQSRMGLSKHGMRMYVLRSITFMLLFLIVILPVGFVMFPPKYFHMLVGVVMLMLVQLAVLTVRHIA